MANKALQFLMDSAESKSAECILWPFLDKWDSGYPRLEFKGEKLRGNRVACFYANGEPPTPKHHAAHSCGNKLCVNGSHLRWATPRENEFDKRAQGRLLQGERVSGAKLTRAQVIELRAKMIPGVNKLAMAAAYGVSIRTLQNIQSGEYWGWLETP